MRSRHSRRKNSPSRVSIGGRLKRGNNFWLRWLRYGYLRLLRLQGTPSAIARGFACGVFAGCFPVFGLQTIFGILLASCLRGNRIAAAAGTWVSNPITDVPILIFNYQVGALLVGGDRLAVTKFSFHSLSELLELGSAIVWVLFIGCFVVGSIGAIATYFLSLRFFRRRRYPRSRRFHPYY